MSFPAFCRRAARAALPVALTFVSSVAMAHVTANPNELPAGAYAVVALRVSHGCGDAPTTTVRVRIPDSVLTARPQPKPGWTVEVVTRPVDPPVAGPHGIMIDKAPVEIVWRGGPLASEHFDQFTILLRTPETRGAVLWLPTIQECGSQSQEWVNQPADLSHWGHTHHPAPFVRLRRQRDGARPTVRRPRPRHRRARAGRAIGLALAATLAGTAGAQAQTPGDSPIVTPPVSVTAPAGPQSLTVPTPEAAREELRRTPGSVEVVPAEDWRASRGKDLKDMVDFVPGVFAQPKFGDDTRLVIRGSGLSRNFHLRGVRFLLDGIPFNLADGSGDTQEVEAFGISHIEIYKGANALRWGASSLGGAINLVTPSGYTADLARARADYGAYDYKRFAVSHGMAVGGWDWFGTMGLLDADNFRDQSKQTAGRIAANLGYRFDAGFEMRFYVIHAAIDQQVPGSLFRGAAYSDPKQAAAINKVNNWQRDIQSTILANRSTVILGEAELSFGGYFRKKDLFHPIFVVIDQDYTGFGGFGRLTWDGTIAGHRNLVLAGLNYDRGNNASKWFVNMEANPGFKLRDEKEKSGNLDAYVENHFYLRPDLALVAGLQVNHSRRQLDDRYLSDGDDSGGRNYTSFNPKAGFVWDVARNWQVYGNVSRSSEPPTFSELNPSAAPGFADIDAQKSITVELGTRGRRTDVTWDLAVYHSWLRDELQTFQDGNGATVTLNAGRTVHRGLEAGFGWAFLRNMLSGSPTEPDRLWLRAAYTFSDFRFADDPVFGDNKLPGAPRHYLRAELRYDHPAGFFIAPNIEWAPQGYWIDNANSEKTKAYALLNLRMGYEFGNGVSAYIDGRNLTNRKYVSSTGVVPVATAANSNVYNPGDRLVVYGGLQVRF